MERLSDKQAFLTARQKIRIEHAETTVAEDEISQVTSRIIPLEGLALLTDRQMTLKCAPGEVHVWRIELDCVPSSLSILEAMLTLEERDRAKRFRSAQLSQRWTVARGALRCVLADYVESVPSSLVLELGLQGKPELAGPAKHVLFNLSHTDGLALLAVSASGRVGIDAERVHSEIDWESISRRFFAPAEIDEIKSLPADARLGAFFACWTRKEALMKALGPGLLLGLDRVRVTVRPDQPARVISMDWDDDPDRWSLVDLSESGLAVAVAVERPGAEVRRFDFVAPLAQRC